MSDDQFTKLFKYIEEFRGDVDKRFDEAVKDRREIRESVADLAGLIKEYHQEMVMLTHQVDRMKEAIRQIAQETGVKLKVEL